MAAWRSVAQRRDHFAEHGREMGFDTIEEYDASAQSTLDVGVYFTYFDDFAGAERTGCYDRASGRFVILNTDDEIISHYACSERYIRRLSYNNYDA
jgi:hypothetical protein